MIGSIDISLEIRSTACCVEIVHYKKVSLFVFTNSLTSYSIISYIQVTVLLDV